jgi:hypothetical protein
VAAAEAQARADEAAAAAVPAPAEQHGLLLPLPPLTGPGRWGCFSLSVKQPSLRCPYGAFEGSCPWHRKNILTGCKKIQRISGPTLQDREDALLRTKFWCAQAFTVDRQRQHVFEVSACGDLDPEMVESLRIDEFPVGDQVVADCFLDAPHAAAPAARKRRRTAVDSGASGSGSVRAAGAGAAGGTGAVTAVAAAPEQGRGGRGAGRCGDQGPQGRHGRGRGHPAVTGL